MRQKATHIEKQQFRALYHHFLFRILDSELLSSDADPERLLGQIATALLSFSALVSVPVLFMGGSPIPQTVLRTFEHFFIATTMLVVGLFSVLTWDAVFPDRLDVLVLAPLPLRSRTIFLAKISSTAAGLGVATGALNGTSGLLWPLLFAPPHSGLFGDLRSLAAFWITLLAAALFVFGSTLTLQGVASQLLPHQLFLRLSAVLQIAVFCLLISVYVLEPSLESHAAMLAPANHHLLACLPSYWFLGLFQQLSGAHAPEFIWLARRAWIAVGAVLIGILFTVLLSYLRNMRKAVEQPDILPIPHRSRWTMPWPRDSATRSILHFALCTILRSRQHRTILSFYLGAGFGVMLILLRPATTGGHNIAVPLLAASVLLPITTAAAMRTVFSIPVALPANWLFRVAAFHPARTYIAAIRRVFLLLAVAPIWICFAIAMLSLWPWRIAVPHLLMLALLGSILADLCLIGFRKIPFTCSYRPGRANLQFAIWGALALLPLTLLGASYEWRSLHTTTGRFLFATALILPAAALRWWSSRAAAQVHTLHFEDLEQPPIVSLELDRHPTALQLPPDPA